MLLSPCPGRLNGINLYQLLLLFLLFLKNTLHRRIHYLKRTEWWVQERGKCIVRDKKSRFLTGGSMNPKNPSLVKAIDHPRTPQPGETSQCQTVQVRSRAHRLVNDSFPSAWEEWYVCNDLPLPWPFTLPSATKTAYARLHGVALRNRNKQKTWRIH